MARRTCVWCRFSLVLGMLAAIILLPVQGRAQVSGATLTGTVTDPSGAVVPKATITISNTATGIVHTAITNSAGRYTVPTLAPGTYDIVVKATGFRTSLRNALRLTVGATVQQNFTLKVGAAAQRVVVSGAVVPIQLASSDIKGVVSNTQVQNLPLNARDWTTLATLQPGVTSISQVQSNPSSTDRTRRGYGTEMAISGSRPQEDSYNIDGINVNDYANSGPGSVDGATLGVAAVQEFSVITSNYSAQYGRTAGGVVNAVTKSGTNQFHGSLYEYVRNSALDASPYFTNPAAGVAKPSFQRNQFGASLGGPIQKNKTFFFGDYEGLKSTDGTPTQALVPSAAVRGIGTGPGGTNGPSLVCSNPAGSGGTCSTQTLTQYLQANGEPAVLDPNPVTGISNLVQPFLALWGLPQVTVGNGDQGIYTFNSTVATDENFGDARVDHKFSNNDSMFGTFQIDRATQTIPDVNNDVLQLDNTRRYLGVVEETHIFGPELINSVRFGYNRSVTTNGASSAINPAAANTALGEAPGQDNPQIDIPSYTSAQPGLNQVQVLNFYENDYQAYDDLFWTHGKNSMSFGFSYELNGTNAFNPAPNGDYSFGSLYDSNNNGLLTNNPLVLAAPVPGVPFVHYLIRTQIFGAYAQDNITVLPNLTVNLGLRYEPSTVPYSSDSHLVALRSPFNQTFALAHIGHTIFSNSTLTNFEPRIGFAWDPFKTGKTSIRGGFGMFDVNPMNYQLLQFGTNAAPFVETASLTSTSAPSVCGPTGTGSCTLAQGDFPYGGITKLTQSVAAGFALRVPYVQPNPGRNYVEQWNFAIEREITSNFSAMVAYVGSAGRHMEFRSDDINESMPIAHTSAGYFFGGPSNVNVLSPAIGQMDTLQWIDNSSYNAMEVQLNKRMSHGFEVGNSFTWGRSIDGGDGTLASDSFLNSLNALFYFLPKYRRGPSDFNVKLNDTLNALWNLPTPFHGGFAGKFTQGWQLGTIVSLQSGLPFTPLIANDPLGLGNTAPFAFPSRLRGGSCSSLVNPGNINNYVKLSCFTLPLQPATVPAGVNCIPFSNPASGTPPTCSNLLGNGGRNEIYGPNLINTDFSVRKNTKMTERLTLQLRAEIFNLFNHPSFLPPIANSTFFNADGSAAANAGALNQQVPDNWREIQLAIQLLF